MLFPFKKAVFLITTLFCLASISNTFADSINLVNGAKIWTFNCSRCHNLRSPKEFKPYQWKTILQHMRLQAGLTGNQAKAVYAYLAAQSGQAQTDSTKNTDQADPSTAKKTANNTSSGNAAAGKTVYKQTCVACHGANGKGKLPGVPDFTAKNGVLKKSNAVLLSHIIHGYKSPGSAMAMPARGGNPKLSNADLKNALAYIRQHY